MGCVRRAINLRADRPLHFLVGGVRFGNHNVGDDAILEGVVKILKKVRPNCEITVLTDQPRYTANKLGVKAFKYQFVVPSSGKINRLFRMISRVFENLIQVYLVLRSDVVVFGGGTILSDSPAVILRLVSWAIFADKRLVHFPGGMNPGNSPDTLKRLLEISKEFDLFMVRDIESKNRLVKAGFKSESVHVTIDPAFNISLSSVPVESDAELHWLDKSRNIVGIGISQEPDCAHHNNPVEWGRIADFLIESLGVDVIFLPSNTQTGKDILAMRRTMETMTYKQRAHLVETELTPQAEILAISQLQIMISSRMHQLIFSALATTPFVGISRCAKIDSFLATFEMNPAAKVSACTLENIRPALEATWAMRNEIRSTLISKRRLLLETALETEKLFAKCLDTISSRPKPHRKLVMRGKSFLAACFMRYSMS